jgi:hypothetical protein
MDASWFPKLSIDAKLEVIYMDIQQQQQAISDLQTATATLVTAKDNLANRIAALETTVKNMGLTAVQEAELLNAIGLAVNDMSVVTNALDLMAPAIP